MKRNDFLTIFSILIVLLFCGLVYLGSSKKPGDTVIIKVGNEIIGTYHLSENMTINLNTNCVTISDGSVYMSNANCPDKLCERQKAISHDGEEIVCLPNNVVISVQASDSPITFNGIYFNTYITTVIYDSNNKQILDNIAKMCQKYELLFSRTNTESELYKLNHRLINPLNVRSFDNLLQYPVSDELYEILEIGLKYSSDSNDSFNIAIAPVSQLWDFSSGKAEIPDENLLKAATHNTNSSDIILNPNKTVSFKSDNNMIDLGAIAKGYIADKIKQYLISENVKSATISLGGNILCLGNKNGKPFKIGIQAPFEATGNYITEIDITDKSVVTSGMYERYFKVDNKIYHHILDSKTGYPVNSDIYGITIISKDSVDGDCLSTWLFSLGKDKALEYASNHPEIDVIVIDKNMDIYRSNNL